MQLLRYQYTNQIKSCGLELDADGMLISFEEYYAFGNTSYQAGRNTTEVQNKRYRYVGKERDEETGLYYMGARYYSPWLCRWCATDPILQEWYNYTTGQPNRNTKRNYTEIAASSYEYCYDNPVMFNDLSGEQVPVNTDSIPASFGISSLGIQGVKSNGTYLTATAGIDNISAGIGKIANFSTGSWRDRYGISFTSNTNVAISPMRNGVVTPNILFQGGNGLTFDFVRKNQAPDGQKSIGIQVEPRINVGDASKQSNISTSVIYRSITKKGNLTYFVLGNDFFTTKAFGPNFGYNGEKNKIAATDGGLTQHIDFGLYNSNKKIGINFSFYGYTAHRNIPSKAESAQGIIEDVTGTINGKDGHYAHNGFVNVSEYAGDQKTYAMATLYRGFNISGMASVLSFSVGFQDDEKRAEMQGKIHNKIGSPEWYKIIPGMYLVSSINLTIKL
jgi:RHS repeat-associated protein